MKTLHTPCTPTLLSGVDFWGVVPSHPKPCYKPQHGRGCKLCGATLQSEHTTAKKQAQGTMQAACQTETPSPCSGLPLLMSQMVVLSAYAWCRRALGRVAWPCTTTYIPATCVSLNLTRPCSMIQNTPLQNHTPTIFYCGTVVFVCLLIIINMARGLLPAHTVFYRPTLWHVNITAAEKGRATIAGSSFDASFMLALSDAG